MKIVDLGERGIVLIDGEERNRAAPATFQIPPRSRRESVPLGSPVKVGFRGKEGNERLWVQVLERTPTGYRGRVDNDPVVVELEDREIITFSPEHILDILPPPPNFSSEKLD